MSSNVSEGQTSYGSVPIADSGAKIPQHIKEVDRNQKFKIFECLQALMQGRLPTNEQLDQFLVMAQDSPAMEARAHMMSADGRSLYNDWKELLRTTRGIVYEKNEQELFQNFIYHCNQASDSVAAKNVQAPNLDVGVSPSQAKKEGKQILDNMVAVAKLVTTNADFRNILNELYQLAKEVFGEGADKIGQGALKAGEKLSAKAADISTSAAQVAQSGSSKLQDGDGIRQASDLAQNLVGHAREDPMGTAQSTRDDALRQANATMDTARMQAADMKKRLAMQAEEFRGQAHTQALEARENAISYANTKMPVEKRNAIIERLKAIVDQIQADPQYQHAIDSMMSLVGTWRQRAQRPADNIAVEANKVVQDPNVEAAIIEFKIILQRWAQGFGLDPMIALVHNMWIKTQLDPELNQYMDNVAGFMNKAVREPNYVTSLGINADAETLIDQGQTLLNVKYKPDTDALMQEGQVFFEKLNNDPCSKEVAANFQRFATHLCYDKKGNLTFKPHLFDDFRYVVMPALMESFQFIPIPHIEYSDLKVDLMFDNMILTSTDLLPRLFEVNMNNTVRMVPRGNATRSLDANKHDFNMFIQGIEANVRDVDYYVKTKEGFKFQDRGIADVLIHKKGMDVRVMGRKTPDDVEVPSMITIDDVKVKIHSLSIKMRKSKHPILYIFAQPFIKTVVKKAIAHALETQIRETLTSGDKAFATSVRDTRIKTGKNTFGAIVDTATSFVTNKVNPDEKTRAMNERKKNAGHYDRTSHAIFDQNGLCVLDPVKHIELKVGQPLHEDPNVMATMPNAPWVSSAFDMHGMKIQGQGNLPGMRRTQGSVAAM
ncbi:hypothetical protein EMPS_00307 [Entomortierella parvispora]|uniref:Uncharacterized protein n=1 Tax=Entomortierella parvispora TaxID=205924 RepID=A0A9P3LRA2_9FUNG|nr:hypothetical protein EMPS_00307 [Entomortierella parvispora]